MKVLFISDPHTFHKSIIDLPEADAICCSGDICLRGEFEEAVSFLAWFSSLPYKHKVFTVGNHDICFDPNHGRYGIFKENFNAGVENPIDRIEELIPEGVHFLNRSGVVLDGIKFWGAPDTPWFHNWAFNIHRETPEMEAVWDEMPEDVDVLLTHGPPFKVLDYTIEGLYVGCEVLARKLETIKPKVHSFGHIHEDYGAIEKGGTLFLNSSVVNRRYWVVNKPHLVEVTKDGAELLE